jgi:hypothetical protein
MAGHTEWGCCLGSTTRQEESRLVPSVEVAVLYRSRQLEMRYMRIHAQLEDGIG